MPDSPPLIQTQKDLAELCAELRSADFVAIDTEFVRERTYYPKLCLVQLATETRLALVDVLSDIELSPLLEALSRPGLLKVLHAARQDLEIFFFLAGEVPAPVFDSQIAAACLGLGEQLSYSSLAEQLLGVDPGKSHARTDWTRRPLSREQLQYATDDVRFLVPIYKALRIRLRQQSREGWVQEAFDALTEARLFAPRPESAHKRVRGARKLDTIARTRLVGLAAWREQLAMQMNRPRKWVVSDDVLLKLAALDGQHPARLQDVPGLPARLRNEQGDVISEIQRRAGEARSGVAEGPKPLSAAENKLLRKLSAAIREEAGRLDTSAALLATREQLAALVRGEDAGHPLLTGWRREVVGEKLLAILSAGETRTG